MVTYYFGFPHLGESNLVKGIASLPMWLSLLPRGWGGGPVEPLSQAAACCPPVPGSVLGVAEVLMY